jgi:hypothetical protein
MKPEKIEKLSLLYIHARGQYKDPTIPFDKLHADVTNRFMEIMKEEDEPALPEKMVEVDGFMETLHNAAILTLQQTVGGFKNIHDLITDLWSLVAEYEMDDITQIRHIITLEELKTEAP